MLTGTWQFHLFSMRNIPKIQSRRGQPFGDIQGQSKQDGFPIPRMCSAVQGIDRLGVGSLRGRRELSLPPAVAWLSRTRRCPVLPHAPGGLPPAGGAYPSPPRAEHKNKKPRSFLRRYGEKTAVLQRGTGIPLLFGLLPVCKVHGC